MAALLRFAKLHTDKLHNICNNVLWIDKTKVNI